MDFSLEKNVLIVMIPYLINKDVFGASYYNDLKFTVKNCNYFYVNLVNFFRRPLESGHRDEPYIRIRWNFSPFVHNICTSPPTPTLPCV